MLGLGKKRGDEVLNEERRMENTELGYYKCEIRTNDLMIQLLREKGKGKKDDHTMNGDPESDTESGFIPFLTPIPSVLLIRWHTNTLTGGGRDGPGELERCPASGGKS